MKIVTGAEISAREFQEELRAFEEAKNALVEAKRKAAHDLSDYLNEHPGQAFTCGDIGRRLGISASQAAQLMRTFGRGLKNPTVLVQRFYVEVDENGYKIPGAPLKTTKRRQSVFTSAKEEVHED